MNFINEIITASKTINLKTIEENTTKLLNEVSKVKLDIEKFIESTTHEHTIKMHKNKYLLNKVTNLNKKLEDTERMANEFISTDMEKCSENVKDYESKINKLTITMNQISHLLNINNTLVDITSLTENKKYVQAILKYNEIESIMKSMKEDENLKALQHLQAYVIEAEVLFMYKLECIFKDNLTFSKNNVDDCATSTIRINMINIEMKQVLEVLFIKNNVNISHLNHFAEFLFKDVFMPIVKQNVNIMLEQGETYVISVKVIDNSRCDYKTVFKNIISIVQQLSVYFPYNLNDEIKVINYVGNKLTNKLSELLINDCLEYTIPSTSEELVQYSAIREDIDEFQKQLIEFEFFTKDTMSLLEYANNIDFHFINLKCQDYLKKSITIMENDLHDYVEVGVPHDLSNPLQTSEFPQCTVSKSAIELLTLINNMLNVATTSSSKCSARIICTVGNIICSYINVVPEYHQKLLQTIPQQVALFHNNCLYLSHELLKFNMKYKSLKIDLTVDVHNLKSVGLAMFKSCIEQHKEQSHKIMLTSGILDVQTLKSVSPQTEKCIRQCLRQLELLKTVWQKVLSYADYNKTIGYLLNGLCEYIIQDILNLVDIPSQAAEQMVDIFKIISTRGPKLFTDSKEINLYVENWYKFNELNFILTANLAGINDRWADGKGPIALQFKPNELRTLIRALFQNTDLRASVLSRIK